jgi:hypothetical protein
MPRLRTPPTLHSLTITAASVSLSVRVKTLCGWIAPFEARYTFTVRDDPYGLQVSLCTLTFLSCSPVTRLLNKINTRYGWMVNPYPTGTFTLQDTLSFAQRDNASHIGAALLRPDALTCYMWPHRDAKLLTADSQE